LRIVVAIGMAIVAPLAWPQPGASAAAGEGARVYDANCAACHQPGGSGIPGAFPPLARHVPALLRQADGRDYLIKVLLFGLTGRIEVDHAAFDGTMPSWSALSDADIAAALNHVSSAWGNDAMRPSDFRAFAANEVKAVRLQPLAATAVFAKRPTDAAAVSAEASAQVAAANFTAVTLTAAQAARGKGIYLRRCVDCHGSTLDNGEFGGAPLNGSYFKAHWEGGPIASLIAYVKARMPPDGPGSLSDEAYIDVVAYLLDVNGYPRGDMELPADPGRQQAMSLAVHQ
jgi:mono/diheme cytochrome c family protein